jgi:hypothetical protein
MLSCAARPHPVRTRHAPRRRGIQYAAASRFNHRCLGIVSNLAPLFAGRGRRAAPGEGLSPRVERVERAPHPTLSPRRAGRGRRSTAFGNKNTPSRSRGAFRPRFASSFALIEKEGAGKTGCALHPRSRVQLRTRTRTRAYRSSGEHPAFPAQWFYGVLRALPGVRIPLATVIRGLMDGACPVGPAHPPRT